MKMELGLPQESVAWGRPDTGESVPWAVRHFNEYLTEEEFADLSAFLQSDLGRKAIETAPVLAKDFGAWVQQEIVRPAPPIAESIKAAITQ